MSSSLPDTGYVISSISPVASQFDNEVRKNLFKDFCIKGENIYT
jgi:hypothetical protein